MMRKPGPRVDTSAPLLYVEHVLKTGKLVHDVSQQRALARQNKELLKRINQIYRSEGFLNVDYRYRVHQSLNSQARMQAAIAIERENGVLLDRLLRKQPAVDSNLPRGRRTPVRFPLTIDFWERTDRRWLCQLAINACPGVSFCAERGKTYRIFQGTCVVLRSNPLSSDEEILPETSTLQDVARGCLVRQRQGDREHLLITLKQIASIAGGLLLGQVAGGSMTKLDLLSYYGTKFGRCKEPIFYDVTST